MSYRPLLRLAVGFFFKRITFSFAIYRLISSTCVLNRMYRFVNIYWMSVNVKMSLFFFCVNIVILILLFFFYYKIGSSDFDVSPLDSSLTYETRFTKIRFAVFGTLVSPLLSVLALLT